MANVELRFTEPKGKVARSPARLLAVAKLEKDVSQGDLDKLLQIGRVIAVEPGADIPAEVAVEPAGQAPSDPAAAEGEGEAPAPAPRKKRGRKKTAKK
jgi:hypothetical protein